MKLKPLNYRTNNENISKFLEHHLKNDEINKTFQIDSSFIKEGVNKDVVDYAKALAFNLLEFKQNKKNNKIEIEVDKEHSLSTSQLRSFFGEIRRIQFKGFKDSESSFYLLKPKLAYAVAKVKNGQTKYQLFKEVINSLLDEVTDEKEFKNFVEFIEAVVAYHKAFGGEQ